MAAPSAPTGSPKGPHLCGVGCCGIWPILTETCVEDAAIAVASVLRPDKSLALSIYAETREHLGFYVEEVERHGG